MTDRLTKEHRSWTMSRIRSKDTKPEKAIRSLLHRAGYRFRLHDRKLPGKPDLVLRKHRTAIFVHGCFWHRHEGCKQATTPKTNQDFWLPKFARTVERDRLAQDQLKAAGWNVIVLWECEIGKNPAHLLPRLISQIHGTPQPETQETAPQAAEDPAEYGTNGPSGRSFFPHP